MALLLSIDTATEIASVCISKHDKVLAIEQSVEQKNHATFVHTAIQHLLATTGYSLQALDAIAVTEGPGSYTGLRVGMATAKGLCYVINKPLITVNTLVVMAKAAVDNIRSTDTHPLNQIKSYSLSPMIDARRMEVFTAIYDNQLLEKIQPQALILDENTTAAWVKNHKPLVLFGSGSQKIIPLIEQEDDVYMSYVSHHAGHLSQLAEEKYAQNGFADLAYSQPFYIKQFFSPPKKV